MCECPLNCEGSVPSSLPAVIAALPESLTGIQQHPSAAKVNSIHQIICFLVSFGPVWEVLVLNLPPYLKKSPPADTWNAEKAREKGMFWKTTTALRLQVSLLNAVLMAVSIINLFSKICKGELHIWYPRLEGRESSPSVRVLIKCMGHCPIIRGVSWPQQQIMDPVLWLVCNEPSEIATEFDWAYGWHLRRRMSKHWF